MESAIWEIHLLRWWSAMIFWECSKFNLYFENAERNWGNAFCFWDYCIWIGCSELSLLRREYLSPAINMLTNILKTLHITQTNIFYSIAFTVINKYGESGVRQISTVFGSLTVLLVEGSSETGIFRHLFHHVFPSP